MLKYFLSQNYRDSDCSCDVLSCETFILGKYYMVFEVYATEKQDLSYLWKPMQKYLSWYLAILAECSTVSGLDTTWMINVLKTASYKFQDSFQYFVENFLLAKRFPAYKIYS